MNDFSSNIFQVKPANFETLALSVFQFQYAHNPIYQSYCKLLNRKPSEVNSLLDIPFLPISSFKTHAVKTTDFNEEVVFTSSGTSGQETSKHFVKDLNLYKKSFKKAFHLNYGNVEDYTVLALLPSYLERSGSSLIYMVESLIKESNHPQSGFYLYNHDALKNTLNTLAKKQEKTLLIGVSFALLDFVESNMVAKNSNLIVMETGGMKGKRKELIREELHQILQQSFQTNTIHSEYGMTELLSQAYSKGEGEFTTPPWMKILIRKQDDPFSYCKEGRTGGINVIDLANIYSCSFIQTDDLGRRTQNQNFEVLGRFDQSEIRGCNLLSL